MGKVNLDSPSQWISRTSGLHYAWVIVGVLALVQMVGLSINFAGGVLVHPLSDPEGQFGFGLGSIGTSYGLYYLAAAALSPIAGWLGDRYGGRRVMALGAVMYGGVLIMTAMISETWHLYVSFGILRGAVQAIFIVPLMVVVASWFRRRLGLGTGVLWAASGFGPAIVSPLLGYMITGLGWDATFLILGAVSGVSILLLAVLFRNRPADLGLEPYGARAGDPSEVVASKDVERLRAKVFNQHTRRTKAFWNLPSIHFLGCAGHGIIMIFVVPLAVSRGLDLSTAAWVLGIISLMSIPSRLLTPVLAERYGPKQVMTACLTVQGLTVLYLFWAQSAWEFYLFAAIFGLGFGGEWTGYMVVNRLYFGHGPMGTVYGWQMTGALLGHAFISGIAGLIVDLTGSYNPILVLSIVASMAGVVVVLLLESTSRELIPDWEESLPPEARPKPTSPLSAAD